MVASLETEALFMMIFSIRGFVENMNYCLAITKVKHISKSVLLVALKKAFFVVVSL